MGMALLADLAAYDFGYVPAGRLVERVGNTLRTMQSLDKHEGHFYNWYDTQSLRPLAPRYISSVDSGNLAGHLLMLRAGLAARCPTTASSSHASSSGFVDTGRVLVDALGGRRFRRRWLSSSANCESASATATRDRR